MIFKKFDFKKWHKFKLMTFDALLLSSNKIILLTGSSPHLEHSASNTDILSYTCKLESIKFDNV